MNLEERTKKIIEELLVQTTESNRCKYLRVDEIGPYCSSGRLQPGDDFEAKRMVCDVPSLQIFCLDKERCERCIYY